MIFVGLFFMFRCMAGLDVVMVFMSVGVVILTVFVCGDLSISFNGTDCGVVLIILCRDGFVILVPRVMDGFIVKMLVGIDCTVELVIRFIDCVSVLVFWCSKLFSC